MSENFGKLKKFFKRYTAIKCAVCGISVGLFSAGALLLILKLCSAEIFALYYALVGIGVSAAVGVPMYFILRPTDRKIAKRLDAEYGLNEKVQTMIAFGGSDGEVAVIQRETTDAKLGAVRPRLRFTEILKQAVAPVLACAMLVAGIAVPSVDSGAGTVDPPYEVTEDQFAGLRQLVKDVKESHMEDNLKASVASVLEGLLETIDRDEDDMMTDSEMVVTVCTAVSVIDGLIASADSYIVIGGELKKSQSLEKIALAVLEGVTSYKADNTRIKTLVRVNEKSERADADIKTMLTESTEEFNKQFDELHDDGLKSALVSLCSIFGELLGSTGYAEKNDGLYKVFEVFLADLKAVADNVGNGYHTSALLKQIANAGSKLTNDGTTVLGVQAYNCMMDEFIRECLSSIFGISLSQFPANSDVVYSGSNSDNPGGPSDPDDDNNNSGGAGDGDELYGSNDIIYSPSKDDYVQYGPELSDYHKIVLDHLDRNNVPDEYRQFITNYFDILYGGIKEKKN